MISEDQLSTWTSPAFDNEEERAEYTKDRIKYAIDNHPLLKNLDIYVFSKGSYANNTNVRRDSDIDVAVRLNSLIKLEYQDGLTFADTGLDPYTGVDELVFKSYVGEALSNEFGNTIIDKTGNKVFRIRGSEKVFNADVIPCTRYQSYYRTGLHEGIQLILNNPDGISHYAFPDQHKAKGIQKNDKTSRRFKHVVRILKNLNMYLSERYKSPTYPSFLLECLAYNVPYPSYLSQNNWKDLTMTVLGNIYNYTLYDDEPSNDFERWMEVNNIIKYLFSPIQTWSKQQAHEFSILALNILD